MFFCLMMEYWFTSIDLKDTYLHVPIVPNHRESTQSIQLQLCILYGLDQGCPVQGRATLLQS